MAIVRSPSLQVTDVTPLLTSNLYEDEDAEKRGVIDVHSDFIIRLNNSITAVPSAQELYLMKYRAFSAVFSTHSILDLFQTSSSHYDKYKAAWEDFSKVMSTQFNPFTLFRAIVERAPISVDIFGFAKVEGCSEGKESPRDSETKCTMVDILTLFFTPIHASILADAKMIENDSVWQKLTYPGYSNLPPKLKHLVYYSIVTDPLPSNEFPYTEIEQMINLLQQQFITIGNVNVDGLTSRDDRNDRNSIDRDDRNDRDDRDGVESHMPRLGFYRLLFEKMYADSKEKSIADEFELRTMALRFVDFTYDHTSEENKQSRVYIADFGQVLPLFTEFGWTPIPSPQTIAKYRDTATVDALLHPYKSWWQRGAEYTGFALLHISKNINNNQYTTRVVRDWLYNYYYSTISDSGEEAEKFSGSTMSDGRIMAAVSEESSSQIQIPFQGEKRSYFYISSDCQQVRSQCLSKLWLIETATNGNAYTLRFDAAYDPDKTTICARPSKMQALEKELVAPEKYGRNWSMFQRDSTLYFSYQFLPHIVFEGQPQPRPLVEENSVDFKAYDNYDAYDAYDAYGSQDKKQGENIKLFCKVFQPTSKVKIDPFYTFTSRYRFSLGTPAIPYNKDEYLAVGHSRFNVQNPVRSFGGRSPIESKNWNAFLQKKNMEPHLEPPLYYYFMFFYTFDRTTLEIRRMSHSFIPSGHEPYWLVFPVGLTKISSIQDKMTTTTTFVVSYGEGDVRCKLMFLERNDIESLLHPLEQMVNSVETHQFLELVGQPTQAPLSSFSKITFII